MGAIFDPDVLHAVARSALDLPMADKVEHIADQLATRYPGHIRRHRPWVLNNAGGAMGAMTVLHASLTEYLIVFGSPIGTEGHTGRFWADDYFMILEGEQWAYGAGELVRRVYRPGDLHHQPRGTAQGYKIPEHCWALEYARGWIPLMLPFGLADTLFSTLDVVTLLRTFRLYGRSVIAELLRGKI